MPEASRNQTQSEHELSIEEVPSQSHRLAYQRDIETLRQSLHDLEEHHVVVALRQYLGRQNDYLVVSPMVSRFEGEDSSSRLVEQQLVLISDGFRIMESRHSDRRYESPITARSVQSPSYEPVDETGKISPSFGFIGRLRAWMGSIDGTPTIPLSILTELVEHGLSLGLVKSTIRRKIEHIQHAQSKSGEEAIVS